MLLKIAVIGTHFTGKTTLCKKLQKFLEKKGIKGCIVAEVVRDCPFPINELSTLQAQDWILNEQKKREMLLENVCDVIIADRSLIDNFAYWMRVAENSLEAKEILKKEEEVFEYSKSYDIIFFLQPFEKEIEDDNFRSINPEWRKEMHKRIEKIIEKFSKMYDGKIVKLSGSEEEVFEQAKKVVEIFLKQIS